MGDLGAGAESSAVTFHAYPDRDAVGKNLEMTFTPTLGGSVRPGAVALTAKIVQPGTLALAVTPDKLGEVVAGDRKEFKATLTNTGETAVADPVVSFSHDSAVDVTLTGDQGLTCTTEPSYASCTAASLPAKDKAEITFKATPDANEIGGRPFLVTVRSRAGDKEPRHEHEVEFKRDIKSPMKLTTAVMPEKPAAGETVRFKVQVGNISAGELSGPRLDHTLSENLTVTRLPKSCTGSDQSVRCSLDPVKPGQTVPAEEDTWLEAKVIGAGELIDSVEVSTTFGEAGNPVQDKVVLKANGPAPVDADLAVTAKSRPGPMKTGEKLRYVVSVRNLGPQTAPPSKLIFETEGPVIDLQGTGCAYDRSALVCELPELKAKSQA